MGRIASPSRPLRLRHPRFGAVRTLSVSLENIPYFPNGTRRPDARLGRGRGRRQTSSGLARTTAAEKRPILALMDMPPSAEERKVVSVLFADLVDSTALADSRDPEDVRAVVRPLHQRFREELERHGGTVEKFVGDAVMAIFGAPVAHEDDAERAVRAALAIRGAVGELEGDLHVRIGVATGEALIDLAAISVEGEGLAPGQNVVNTGFRIAAAAASDGIVVDEPTYFATRDGIAYRSREPVHAKGKAEPVPVWEVEEARPAPQGQSLPPFVGREDELAQARAALVAARDETAVRLLTILGVPGIGKSRLVRELRAETDADVTWMRGRSLSYGEETAFGALAEIVKSYAGVLRTDGPEEAGAKLRAALPEGLEAGEAEWIESQVRALVGISAPLSAGREESFAAWRRLLEAIAAERPLGLLFEDLHWADEGLLEFIDHLVAGTGGVPMLVVCTSRPELLERHPAWGRAYESATTVSLGPLAEEETLELVSATLRRVVPEHLEAVIADRVDGNPLYAQEYARMLVDRGLPMETTRLPLPESVQAVIAARMDGLSPEEKALVHDGAVVGRTVWVGALAAMSGLPRYTVDERLQALEQKEFLRREPISPVVGEASYSFHHVLVRDVAYGQIPRAARAKKHARAAEWLESVTSRREDLAEMIAHHYQSALELARASGGETFELVERARRALREAGERALRLNAHAAAAQFFLAALELLPEDDPERARLEFSYGKALARSDQTGEHVLEDARAAFVATGDLETAADADVELSDLLQMQGRHDESLRMLERAQSLLANEPPSRPKARVLSKLSAFLLFGDRSEEGTRVGFEALLMAEELELADVRAHALTNLGFARAVAGDRGGLVDLERSIAISLELNSPEVLRGYINLGTALANLGELEAAFGNYGEGLRLAKRFGDTRGILWFTAEGIYESYWSGRWDEALETIERLLGQKRVLHATRFDCHLVRGWIRLARDEEEYLDDAEVVLEHARAESQYLFPALSFRARALVAAGRRDEGREAVSDVLGRWTSRTTSYTSFWLADLVVAGCSLGSGSDVLAAVDAIEAPNRWLDAARAYAEGQFDDAASRYDEIGSKPDAAYARLRAAEVGAAKVEARARLSDALAFFRDVEAAAYVRQAEELLAPS
jgi:class 3 adenylate cyclase/tetratricopeptide (TPR) repeat protein